VQLFGKKKVARTEGSGPDAESPSEGR